MADTVEIIIKTVDQTTATTKNIGAGFKDLMGTLAKIVGVAIAAGAALKKAIDLGEEGAKVEVLRQSVQSLGVDLEAIQKAANGTVSEFDAMAATATILAGTQGDLKQAFLDNTAHLMEIAKAANTVNPALGDTTFLYESLARGIKRSSPLILDNLGLVVKVGAANEEYAKQLGKTVDELTAEEKQMALLNATIKAGNVLIEQASGINTDTADSYARLKATWTDLTNAWKIGLSADLLPVVDGLQEGASAALELAEAKLVLKQAEMLGLMTGEEYGSLLSENAVLSAQYTGESEDLREKIIEVAEAYQELIEKGQAVGKIDPAFFTQTELFEEMAVQAERAADAVTETKKDFQELYGVLNKDWGAEFLQFTEDLAFWTSGGTGFAAVNDQLNETRNVLLNVSEDALKVMEPALVDVAENARLSWLEYQVEMGNMSAYDAAKQAVQELGMKWNDAYLAMTDAGSAVEELAGYESELKDIVTWTENIAEAAALMGIPFGEANSLIGGIYAYMEKLDGMTIEAFIKLIVTGQGNLPNIGGGQGGGNKEPPDTGPVPQAFGGAVEAGRSYFVGEMGPEIFTPNENGYIIPNKAIGEDGAKKVINNFYAPVNVSSQDETMMDLLGLRVS